MRKFAGIKFDNLEIANYYILNLGHKKAWVFHGDVFDVTMQHSKWMAKLGAKGYGFLILLNRAVNALSAAMGRGPVSLSKRIKNGVKSAGKSKTIFEETATEIASQKGYDYVICGHIHQPESKCYQHGNQSVQYLNSGDWVENMSALEYHDGQWGLYFYQADPLMQETEAVSRTSPLPALEELSNKLLFINLLSELELLKR
jgi:UDP-2,3-diacylglucosamine pyrophosphatase LpxH